MDYAQLLEEEYTEAGKEPVYCQLGMGCSLLVPVSYKGDKQSFAEDLFKHKHELKKYKDFNRQQGKDKKPIDPQMISCGEVSALVPVELVINNYNDQIVQEKLLKRAMRHYNSTLRKTLRARKEYPHQKIAASLDKAKIQRLEWLHGQYCAKEVAKAVGKVLKSTAKEVTQISAGVALVLPAFFYRLLKKNNRIAPSEHTMKIDQKVIPYIRKGVLKAAVLGTLLTGVKLSNSQVFSKIKTEKAVKEAIMVKNQRHKLETTADFEKFYNASKASAFLSTLPTETLVTKPYSDNKSGKINTIGSFYYLPKDGKPETEEWIKASDYFKSHPNMEITGQEAYELWCGFFDSKENGRLKNAIKSSLMGCELKICELDAIKSVMLNNEMNGIELCNFVKENYKDPVKCAAKIMSFTPKNAEFNDGIAKRRVFEAATYLNLSNINNRLPDFMQKKTGKVRSLTAVTQLDPDACQTAFIALQQGDTKPLEALANQMCNFCCRGQTLYEITEAHGIDKLWSTESRTIKLYNAMKGGSNAVLYREAQQFCDNQQYAKAEEIFQKLEANGACGADLYNDMAMTYYQVGNYQKAIDCCKATVKTKETNAYAAANHIAGMAYLKMGNLDKAAENAKLATARAPNNKEYQQAAKEIYAAKAAKATRTAKARS